MGDINDVHKQFIDNYYKYSQSSSSAPDLSVSGGGGGGTGLNYIYYRSVDPLEKVMEFRPHNRKTLAKESALNPWKIIQNITLTGGMTS